MNFRGSETVVKRGTHRRPSLLTCIPTFGMVSIDFHIAAQRLQVPVNCRNESMVIVNEEIGVARNEFAKHILSYPKDKRPEYLFCLGDDMLPQWSHLIELWKEMRTGKWDVLAGLYFLKQEPPVPILWRNEIDGFLEEGIHYKSGEVVDSDICGMDFTLIRPEIFEKMKEPYFKTAFTDKTENMKGGIWLHTEDAFFVKNAKEVGARVGVHTGVRVGHIDISTGVVY